MFENLNSVFLTFLLYFSGEQILYLSHAIVDSQFCFLMVFLVYFLLFEGLHLQHSVAFAEFFCGHLFQIYLTLAHCLPLYFLIFPCGSVINLVK